MREALQLLRAKSECNNKNIDSSGNRKKNHYTALDLISCVPSTHSPYSLVEPAFFILTREYQAYDMWAGMW